MPSEMPKTADAIVIGGGVMGASTAYHLARAGVKNVVLLEKEPYFGQGATGRCAGGIRHQFATEVNVRLSIASLAMLDRFEEETGQDPGVRKCGYLFVLTDARDVASFEENLKMQQRLGVATRWMTPDEIHARLPMMDFPDALGGTYNPDDGLADPNSVVMGYIQRARALDARPLTGVEVRKVLVKSGNAHGVVTQHGAIEAPVIVNAAGPWAGLVGKMAGVDIPITPLRRQMITTTPLPDLPEDFPFVIDFAQSLYFHREGEGLLTGMSNPGEDPGFDQSIDEAWEVNAIEAAAARMPMLEHAGRLSAWAGLYEVTPDAHPIFGPTPVDGFFIVGGFSGHGFMHGPISGKLMQEFILEGEAKTVDVSTLDLARFEQGRLIHEYNVV
ncbi:MAG: FAD-binding oxidoreductase [Anaerolineales bacterium]|nr:FAD-binding oxidoreductase [Anaerolineales bacterium]